MYADDAGGSGDNTLTVWTWDLNFNVYAIEKAAEIYAQDHEGFKKYNAMSGDSINLDSLRDTILEMGVDGEQMLRELDDFLKDEK